MATKSKKKDSKTGSSLRGRVLPTLRKANPLTFLKRLVRRILGLFKTAIGFLRASFAELKQVTWVSRKDTLKFSGLIIGFIVVSATIIALIDLVLFRVVRLLTTT